MKKVLFTATVDSHILKFHIPYLCYFKERGYQVHVASNGEEKIPYADVKFNVPFERSPFSKRNIIAYKEMKKIVNENEYQIIHTNTPMGGVVTRLAARNARKRGANVIYTAHGFHFYKTGPLFNWLVYYPIEKYLSKITDCLITINNEDFEVSKRRFKTKLICHVNGVGIDLQKFKETDMETKIELRRFYGYNVNDFILIYPAELSHRKNQEMLIEVLVLLKNEIPGLKLILAGEETLKGKYYSMAEEKEVIEKIDFLGFRTDISALLALSDILVTTSKQEGLPVNVMEAMASKKPIIASNIRGHVDLIQHELNGLLFDYQDVNLLRKHILNLYNNRRLSETLGANSQMKISEYSTNSVMHEMANIYEKFM